MASKKDGSGLTALITGASSGIGEALARSQKGDNAAFRYSFDMLGEGALTTRDALRYLQAYRDAIHAIGKSGDYRNREVFGVPSISVNSTLRSTTTPLPITGVTPGVRMPLGSRCRAYFSSPMTTV